MWLGSVFLPQRGAASAVADVRTIERRPLELAHDRLRLQKEKRMSNRTTLTRLLFYTSICGVSGAAAVVTAVMADPSKPVAEGSSSATSTGPTTVIASA